jgi:hypothetical protein
MRIVKIRRRTRKIFIENDLAFENGWYANVTSVDLMFFGIKASNLHKYYFTYSGKFSSLI